jgi:hypothetical protein
MMLERPLPDAAFADAHRHRETQCLVRKPMIGAEIMGAGKFGQALIAGVRKIQTGAVIWAATWRMGAIAAPFAAASPICRKD